MGSFRQFGDPDRCPRRIIPFLKVPSVNHIHLRIIIHVFEIDRRTDDVRRVVQARDFGSDLVNVAQNRGYTVTELVELLKELTNYEGKITYNTRYQDGSPKKVMDDRVFRQRFPDFAFTSLADGLRETVDYYRRIL